MKKIKDTVAPSNTGTTANKTIWTLWYQGLNQAPDHVKQCINSWSRLNPNYRIEVLDRNTLRNFIELPEAISPEKRNDISITHYSDVCRLALLLKYGGVWTDATVFCCKSLDSWLHEYDTTGFFAFRNPGTDRMMANWFIASAPNNIITSNLYEKLLGFYTSTVFTNQNTKWGNAVIRILSRFLNRNYKTTLFWHSKIIAKVLKVYPYLIFHYTFNKIILKNPECRKVWSDAKTFNAEKPLSLLNYFAIDKADSLEQAIEEINRKESPLYKLSWKVDMKNNYWSNIMKYLNQTGRE